MLPGKKRAPERAEFLADVLTTAVEGGVQFWANVSNYHWYDPAMDSPGTGLFNVGEANAYVTIHEVGSELEHGRVVVVGVDAIATAIKRIVVGEFDDVLDPCVVKSIKEASLSNDGGEIDAGLASIIMQVAALGEVIYE